MINGRSVYQKMSKEEQQIVKDLQADVNSHLMLKSKCPKKVKKATVYDIAAEVTPEEETL